jgi:predicted RNA-binding Zn ribbon-like protein
MLVIFFVHYHRFTCSKQVLSVRLGIMSNEFIAGRACLDFANTVDWRTSGAPEELLHGYDDFVSWSHRAGLLEPGATARLRQAALADPRAAERAFARALELREAMYRTFLAQAHEETPRADDLRLIAGTYADAVEHAELVPGSTASSGYAWSLGDAVDLDRPSWALALSATDLLGSNELARVGECGGRGCGWLFLDETRNHARRWCVSGACGNRERVRRYYARRRQAV